MRSVKYNPKKNIIGLSERGDPVSKVRQVFYLVLECCIFVVLAVVPGVFALQKNVFRQLPLYRFLEGQAVEDLQRQDQETYESWWRVIRDILERWCVKKIKMRE